MSSIAEKSAIRVAMFSGLFMSALGFVFATLVGSEAILLDGVYSLVNVFLAALTLKVASLVRKPGDSKQPFGYWSYEAVLNLTKGIFILLISAFAAVSSVIVIMDGGRKLEADMAVLYASIATVGCLLVAIYLYRVARKTQSQLVYVDFLAWRIDAALSGGIAVAFVLMMLLEKTELQPYLVYVDPVLVLLLIVVSLSAPLKMVKKYAWQVLGRLNRHDTVDALEDAIDQLGTEAGYRVSTFRVAEMGRIFYLQLYLLPEQNLTLEQLDQLRQQVYARAESVIKPDFQDFVFDCVFTRDENWALRSVFPRKT